MKVLIISVGGACEPIIRAIEDYNPDKIFFFCSQSSSKVIDGPGKPCYDKKVSVKAQLNLNSNIYEKITIDDDIIDNITECYKFIFEEFSRIFNSDNTYIVDYTPGTKTMSVSLVLLALQYENLQLSLVRGNRHDLVKTVNKTEMAVNIDKSYLLLNQKLQIINEFLKNYYYSTSIDYLLAVIKKMLLNSKKIIELKNILEGFDCWDKFNYNDAIVKLRSTPYSYMIKQLKLIAGEIKIPFNFYRVFDLMLNIERTAKRGLYDDAVSRIYRTLELFSQIYLKEQYDVNNSDIDLTVLPLELRKKYKDYSDWENKIKIGLKKSYQLILDLQDNKIGPVYKSYENKLLEMITLRNESKLAHGDIPINKSGLNNMKRICFEFLNECFEKLNLRNDLQQLPNKIELKF